MTTQAMTALARANEVYSLQAAALREVRNSSESADLAASQLRNPSEIVGSIRLERFLRSIRRVGPTRAARYVREAGLAPGRLTRRIRELTERERRSLAATLVRKPRPPLTAGQRDVLASMNGRWLWADEIAGRIGSTPQTVGSQLTGLRLRGLVESRTVKSGDGEAHLWRKASLQSSDPTAHETPGASSEEPRAHLSSPGARPASPKVGIGAGVSSGRAAA